MVRNGETLATAEIGAVAGTDYTYLLVVPMGMLPPVAVSTASALKKTPEPMTMPTTMQAAITL